MAISESQMHRARYVRTVLAWHDLTQADLGRLLGISAQAANRKLKGIRRFSDDELLAIADAFELDPGHMLRPPSLGEILGTVSQTATGLLTCTFKQLPQVRAFRRLPLTQISVAVHPRAA